MILNVKYLIMIIICNKINIFLGNFKELCKLLAKSNEEFGKKLFNLII
jgi:hypothetical protein